jgi:hypothetical protein
VNERDGSEDGSEVVHSDREKFVIVFVTGIDGIDTLHLKTPHRLKEWFCK